MQRIGFDEGKLIGDATKVFAAPGLAPATSYDVTADETRIIAVQLNEEAVPTEIRVITNFFNVIRTVVNPDQRP